MNSDSIAAAIVMVAVAIPALLCIGILASLGDPSNDVAEEIN